MNRRLPPAMAYENVAARLKWYNPTKGFGFVRPPDVDKDAFLHASVIAESGMSNLPEGATIQCDIVEGNKGLQVAAVHSIDLSTAANEQVTVTSTSDPVEGVVKFFNTDKGFGFVSVDGVGKDVFISTRILERCGVMSIESEQRVRVTMRDGQKGPLAESIEIL